MPDPGRTGGRVVQVLRTYPYRRMGFPFAPDGERSIARAYEKAFSQANRLIYVEDQYLWSGTVAQGIVDALERSPELRVIAVVPRYPDQNSATNGPPQRLGQLKALTMLKEAAPDRVAVYDIESDLNVPIYVHAKICIVDDVWFTCGSDNFNRRSWTNDSELTCAVIDPTRDERQPLDLSAAGDGARKLARDLRLELWSEHLGRKADDPELLDPATAFDLWKRTAADLDAWHAGGRSGARAPGQIRAHNPEPVEGLTKLWAEPAYRVFFDPDDRPWRWRDRLKF
jgi:phosphatidylserine/phosphatidylglycerophosphate/cardiolipin synthase-like enzyme